MIHFFKTIVTVTHPSALVKPHFQDYNKKSFRFREDYGLFQAVSPVSGLTPDYPENTRRPEAVAGQSEWAALLLFLCLTFSLRPAAPGVFPAPSETAQGTG